MHLRLLPMAALLLCAACGKPTDVAVQFHTALARDEGAKAFGMLSQSTQAKLTRIASKSAKLSSLSVRFFSLPGAAALRSRSC